MIVWLFLITRPHIIHVNRQHIAMNAKDGGSRPVFTVKTNTGENHYAREVRILGPSRLVSDGRVLPCGARAWIETTAELDLTDRMTFREARADADRQTAGL